MSTPAPRIFKRTEDLAPAACRSDRSRGRVFSEPEHPYRSPFQRDRERIIHSTAFRRLEYKTQVFINHEGDHFRTRLTHSIEVAQIARSAARALGLNEDLAESIALAHDLGHTPFGHAGERELNRLLAEHGGFEHNRQSLRVVDILEKRYELFEGLNLTYETREGIIKHSSDYDHPDCRNFNPHEQPSIEAQLIDLADEIAYNNHDLDDGISSGLLDIAEAEELAIWKLSGAPSGLTSMKREELKLAVRSGVRSIINLLVTDLIRTTSENISALKIESLEDARSCGRKVSGFSDEVKKCNNGLKLFLKERLYRHYRVSRMTIKAENVIRELFNIYTKHPETLPDAYRELADKSGIFRTVTDYIAGMTDRYALEEQKKLTDPSVKS